MLSVNSYTSKKQVILKFAVFTTGILLNFAGYLVLLGLQSSINIKDGAGADSVTATYVTAAIFGITFTPVILRQFGTKTCILISEVTYLIYILINYYPEYFTLIPAGVIVGVGEATMWPAMMLFCVHFARCYACYGKKKQEFYVTSFLGTFYLIFQFSAVFGNLLNYAILYGGKTPLPNNDENSTAPTPVDRNLLICGANDCQDPNVTDANLNRYEPASQTLVYILIGVTAGLVIIAIFIQACFVEAINSNQLTNPIPVTSEEESNDKDQELVEKTVMQSIFSTIKETFLHLIKPKQLLITPFALYSGLVIYFGLGEVTRAFGSCIMGVEQVGLLAALTGGADGIASYLTSTVTSRYGRHVTMVFGFFLDMAFYMTCLFWVPTEDSVWVVYLIFIGIGISDGTWQPLVNDMHSAYFPEDLDIALSVWNLFVLIGLAWQAGWSTALCVFEKIYFQISFLCFSIICYYISQRIYYKKKNTNNQLGVKTKI